MYYIVQKTFLIKTEKSNAMREKVGIFNSKIITLRQSYYKNIIDHSRLAEIHIV